MTLNIAVDGKLEAALKARAQEQGIPADKVARRMLAQSLTPEEPEENTTAAWTTGEEKALAFVQWAKSHRSLPLLSDDAISRSSLNPDRW
jgi:plasmid stability protein